MPDVTREILQLRAISEAIGRAFDAETKPVSARPSRPQLSAEDCEDIARIAFDAVNSVKLGPHGIRTIHGGKI